VDNDGMMDVDGKSSHPALRPVDDTLAQTSCYPVSRRPNPYQDMTFNFRHFLPPDVMLVKYGAVYALLPGGFGNSDELAEILTLGRTGKTQRIPIILVHEPVRRGLVDWFRDILAAEDTISLSDLRFVCHPERAPRSGESHLRLPPAPRL
jgi:predicted Rossmann-fold nucleotide-binding protein